MWKRVVRGGHTCGRGLGVGYTHVKEGREKGTHIHMHAQDRVYACTQSYVRTRTQSKVGRGGRGRGAHVGIWANQIRIWCAGHA